MPSDDAPVPLLRHVAHELRTRLAAATAAVEGLRDTTVDWTDDDRRELLAVAQTSLESIRLLLGELSAAGTSMGLVGLTWPPGDAATPLRTLVAAGVADLGDGIPAPRTHLPESLPPVLGDPTVLRLVVVSVLRHAVRSSTARRLDVRAATRGDRVLVRFGPDAPRTSDWRQGAVARSGRLDREKPLGADLSVARDLARLLGGSLREVQAGRGADPAIVVELPAGARSVTHAGRLPGE